MSGASRNGWIVATSIGAVEALKDQLGVCRWNYGLKSIQQNAKKYAQSYYHSHLSPPDHHTSDSSFPNSGKKIERREKGFKKALDLSCWGPTTVRF